jgi:UDP-N-acetylglucosamine diphosphorylase / glucose-1-phosphate thymidylyltransferase / UDP-N-acetylgalactosamine diphosphorylase / glucosamine-1-phosphate N-acetyltransferase / galactosamine-1-phosphate N-acetyltransferase
MDNKWLEADKLTCVVICAGRGSRILPYSEQIPKTMICINNKPILHYIIEYWKKYTSHFVFVVGYKKDYIIDYTKNQGIQAQFVEQTELNGIAAAISLAKNLVSENFIVVLGDCICQGTFILPNTMTQGIGVWETKEHHCIKNNYAVLRDNGTITKVIEKPDTPPNDLCGMGVYFLNKKVFDYINKTTPSTMRNEIEITDVIQKMINDGEKITPVTFQGTYLNINFPQDLKKAAQIMTTASSTDTPAGSP